MFIYDNTITFEFCGVKFVLSDFRIQLLTQSYPTHYHGKGCYEIHFFKDGNGEMLIENKIYPITNNTLFITGPFINHEQRPLTPLIKYSIYFTIYEENTHKIIKPFLDNVIFSSNKIDGAYEVLSRIEKELKNKKIGYLLNVENLLKLLIITIIRSYDIKNQTNNEIKQNDLSFKIEAIFLKEFKSITLTEMANRLFISTRQLQRYLQKNYKKTFNDLKLEARMNYAKNLLKNSDMTIGEISLLCGYSSTEHFSQAFKKQFQITPLKYKKNQI